MKFRKITKFRRIFFKKIIPLATLLFSCVQASVNVYAASTGSTAISSGLTALTTLATDAVSGIGVFVTLWGIFEIGNAMQNHDGSMQAAAGKRITGGMIMVVAPQLLQLFI